MVWNLFFCFIIFFVSIYANAQALDSSSFRMQDSLMELSMKHVQKKEMEQAISLARLAMDTSAHIFGKETAQYASALFNYGRVQRFVGNLEESEQYYLKALDLRKDVLGTDHPDYAQNLFNLGALYMLRNINDKAEQHFKLSLEIRRRVLGEDHPDLLYNLGNLADLYYRTGRYKEGLVFIEESLSKKEKLYGKMHPSYASSLIWKALLLGGDGDVLRAIDHFVQAKNILDANGGAQNAEYANCLNNLAMAYNSAGHLDKVEPLLLEVIEIRKKLLGPSHLNTIRTVANLAIFYVETGNLEKAEPLLLESREIIKSNLGTQHTDYARCLNNLAGLYNRQEKYDLVLPLYLEQLSIQAGTIGTQHPDYAISLNNLGVLYEMLGKYDLAEERLMEALSVRKNALGEKNYEYGFTLKSLGHLHRVKGEFDKAESYLLRAASVLENSLGKEHVEYVQVLYNLSLLYMDSGRYNKALEFIGQMAMLDQMLMEKAVLHFSEEELQKYQSTFLERQQEIFRLSRLLAGEDSRVHGIAFDQALFEKGFILQARDRLRRISAGNPEFKVLFTQYNELHAGLAGELSKPIAARNQALVDSLVISVQETEKSLARRSADFDNVRKKITWADVLGKLTRDEVAIEFIRLPLNLGKRDSGILYAAMLVRGESQSVGFVALTEESALDSLLYTRSDRKADFVNNLYTLADRGAIAVEAPRKSLYELLWQPLEGKLNGVRTIYFSPAGLLHRINLDAIPVSETETLADRYNLVELGSTRQLVSTPQIKSRGNEAVLYGGIQFEQDSTAEYAEPLFASRSREELSFAAVDSSLRGGSWNFLVGTEREVSAIEKIMMNAGVSSVAMKGNQATEESFKKLGSQNGRSPRILHVATHGYFFSDLNRAQTSELIQEPVFKISDHPMLRSGLILAGGNATWQGRPASAGREDGILTAYEISQMDLSNTELVVLSACETGLGDIRGNEGVYGLQRAFKIAGAKYLIMSLWQVPDKQTSLLMTTFYKKWLEERLTIPDAFHAAQKQLRDSGLEAYYWAGFVLVE